MSDEQSLDPPADFQPHVQFDGSAMSVKFTLRSNDGSRRQIHFGYQCPSGEAPRREMQQRLVREAWAIQLAATYAGGVPEAHLHAGRHESHPVSQPLL